jgi:hypothetical protein
VPELPEPVPLLAAGGGLLLPALVPDELLPEDVLGGGALAVPGLVPDPAPAEPEPVDELNGGEEARAPVEGAAPGPAWLAGATAGAPATETTRAGAAGCDAAGRAVRARTGWSLSGWGAGIWFVGVRLTGGSTSVAAERAPTALALWVAVAARTANAAPNASTSRLMPSSGSRNAPIPRRGLANDTSRLTR